MTVTERGLNLKRCPARENREKFGPVHVVTTSNKIAAEGLLRRLGLGDIPLLTEATCTTANLVLNRTQRL